MRKVSERMSERPISRPMHGLIGLALKFGDGMIDQYNSIELDVLIAKNIMGWTDITKNSWGHYIGKSKNTETISNIYKYCENIVAAWDVFEWLCDQSHKDRPHARPQIQATESGYWVGFYDSGWYSKGAYSNTVSCAICLCALYFLEIK